MFRKPDTFISTDDIKNALDLGPYPRLHKEKEDKVQDAKNISLEIPTIKNIDAKKVIDEIVRPEEKETISNTYNNSIKAFDPSRIVWL